MIHFKVEPEVFQALPGLRIVVAWAEGVENGRPSDVADARWRAAWSEAQVAAVHGNAQSHPHVRPWRERMQALGVSTKKFPSSVEALLRRALKGGEPFRINPLVDLYNSISLEHVAPVGGFDVAGLEGGRLALRRTRPGDRFHALGAEAAEEVPPGEIAYLTGNDVLTRHVNWRQSERAAITPATREVFLMSEVLPDLPEPVAAEIRGDFTVGLRTAFGAEVRAAVVDVGNPGVSFP